jgi:co-chaperonin GroES (HSP10)
MKVSKPCGHNVLVKLKRVEQTSKAGIILATEKELKRQQYGVEYAYVEQLGDSAYAGFADGTPWCQPGDLVAIKKYSGCDFEHKDEIFRVILDDDVVAVLEDEGENNV